MAELRFDITQFLDQDEGQHFDRKSLYEGPDGDKRSRNRRAVRDQVAEYVAESWESRRSSMTLADLDEQLLERARQGAGLSALTDEEYLLKRKLADRRGRGYSAYVRRDGRRFFAKTRYRCDQP